MSKSKLTIEKVINKSFIVWGQKFDNSIKVIYKWEIKDDTKLEPCDRLLVVDYDKNKREWYITYFKYDTVFSCTIDDISGTYSMTTF
jgi:hypothetical protein